MDNEKQQANISKIARKIGCSRRYVQLVKSGKAGMCKTAKQLLILKELEKGGVVFKKVENKSLF
jgi:hypothetical protein